MSVKRSGPAVITFSRPAAAVATVLLLAVALAPRPAHAQYGMGMPGGGMPQPPSSRQQPKDEGPAEQAPEDETRPSDLEPLSAYSDQGKRRAQLFEVDGYFRMRNEYMHNFFLSQGYTNKRPVDAQGGIGSGVGLPPFPVPLSCPNPAGNTPTPGTGNCSDKDNSTTSIRLRLEPTLNVTDQVRVRAQIDVLDNTILGSTPDSLAFAGLTNSAAPVPFLFNTQDPPEVGQNGQVTSIRAKRAWAEVDTEYGSLRFGRMPWHFGRGIMFNDGSCQDCIGGTTVDRLAGLTEVYSHQIMLGIDFGSQGQTLSQTALATAGPMANPNGPPLDLAQDDDVFQYVGAVTKIDNPIRLRERIDRGDLVFNYGAQLVYRTEQAVAKGAAETCASNGSGLCAINAFMFKPNIWMKLYYRSLTIEFEGAGVLGRMDRGGILLDNSESEQRTYIRQFGWVLASELRLYRDTFFLGVETGGATGDQAEDSAQYLNHRWRHVRQPVGDHSIRDFKFSPEYHVDSILFRNILGTVTNAVYVKPALAYWFDLMRTRQVGIAGSFIYSVAQIPVSTPGNALAYGLEMNVSATYRNTGDGFYAGMTWGVLWPLGALDRPAPLWGQYAADAKAAQVLRGFLGIKF